MSDCALATRTEFWIRQVRCLPSSSPSLPRRGCPSPHSGSPSPWPDPPRAVPLARLGLRGWTHRFSSRGAAVQLSPCSTRPGGRGSPLKSGPDSSSPAHQPWHPQHRAQGCLSWVVWLDQVPPSTSWQHAGQGTAPRWPRDVGFPSRPTPRPVLPSRSLLPFSTEAYVACGWKFAPPLPCGA